MLQQILLFRTDLSNFHIQYLPNRFSNDFILWYYMGSLDNSESCYGSSFQLSLITIFLILLHHTLYLLSSILLFLIILGLFKRLPTEHLQDRTAFLNNSNNSDLTNITNTNTYLAINKKPNQISSKINEKKSQENSTRKKSKNEISERKY